MECNRNKTVRALNCIYFMPKIKTNKSILSRLKISGAGKLIRRAANQSHFNSKDSGNKGRLKHKSANIKKSDQKLFRQYIPYNK